MSRFEHTREAVPGRRRRDVETEEATFRNCELEDDADFANKSVPFWASCEPLDGAAAEIHQHSGPTSATAANGEQQLKPSRALNTSRLLTSLSDDELDDDVEDTENKNSSDNKRSNKDEWEKGGSSECAARTTGGGQDLPLDNNDLDSEEEGSDSSPSALLSSTFECARTMGMANWASRKLRQDNIFTAEKVGSDKPKDQQEIKRKIAKDDDSERAANAASVDSTEDEREAALNRLGIEWSVPSSDRRDRRWYEWLEQLRAYGEESEGGLTGMSPALLEREGRKPLASWVKRQRTQYRKKQGGEVSHLSDEKENALKSIGFPWR
uniref:Helicase-associated domain-containing protein n=1 Tax=Odontella aurita TaxID=265563 RepID=A0A7S4IPF6_9STRA|mmetsp:Transcript_2808/g.7371  ORF Transcript_2808/g.7371 Transcript_2808/m.7371 type:complete len:324 (+) Transcript_2808:293-1264(+)